MRRLVVAAGWLLALCLTADAHPPQAGESDRVVLRGQTFVNQGLVGAGMLPAGTVDFLGDTLGSFSSLAVARGSWKRAGDGFEATLWTLPDRGRNDPDAGLFFDYAARLHRFRIRFRPRDGRLDIVPDGGLLLRDFRGQPFTGADPGDGTRVERGLRLPSPPAGSTGAGKVSLDAESLQFTRDGGFYVGDEYAANVYYFDKTGRLRGAIRPPAAVEPRSHGKLDFGSTHAPRTGRRNNQGIEGLSLSPDGKTLFVVLQSALVQDSARGDASGRNNTRVLVYDVRNAPLPEKPVGHYVLRLPTYDVDGAGGKPNRTAAQSEVRALNDHQFLALARDGAGVGATDGKPVVYKAILLVDLRGATNLAGSAYETGTASVLRDAGNNALRADIRPVEWVELVNLLDPAQLARVGLGIDQLSEKWEAMDLVPALDPGKPDDYFLLVGNDNDFIARRCVMQGQRCDSDIDNDNRILVYRVTLPCSATTTRPICLAASPAATAPPYPQGIHPRHTSAAGRHPPPAHSSTPRRRPTAAIAGTSGRLRSTSGRGRSPRRRSRRCR